ncbi:hypothetical protein L226DRAFT_177214 [Lentinus tigrinus ALCF2SS1-7]|uniref:uncharacterized protein n=1 Tax=Lentinus tigrinus ALCF2SS1-7 TaxID=1328758 RepID=UPI001166118C|nr:hypothetical protein L226DRAFT_177214 [Lentinus tigrinus ALCF2SS1-7]
MGFAAMFVSLAYLLLSLSAPVHTTTRTRIDVRSPPSSPQLHTSIVNVIAISQAYTPPLVSSHRILPLSYQHSRVPSQPAPSRPYAALYIPSHRSFPSLSIRSRSRKRGRCAPRPRSEIT